jgi:hypothetical protein
VVRIARGEAKFAHKVVLDLVVDVEEKGHVISMNNFFTFIGLFEDLALKQIYATSTMRSNWSLEWMMHQSCRMSSIVWEDKKLVLILSIHAISIDYFCMRVPTMPGRNGTE